MFGFVVPLQQVMYFYFSSLVICSNFQSGVSSVFCGWLGFMMSGAVISCDLVLSQMLKVRKASAVSEIN